MPAASGRSAVPPPGWAAAPTVHAGPLLTYGQQLGYRVRRPGGDRR
ncbi:hypothetical protein [Micromonospora sp. NBC_01796]|nr:hypothetical protein [Micromonospora sp. NBC_01796]WSA86363.1 hypothetical protein OIE47_01710 [Micromonospora sp. NBC_01796]